MKKMLTLPRALVLGLAVALLASLAVNLLAAGWVLGQRVAAPQHMERGMLRHMARHLPAEVRAPLREAMRERRRPLFDAFRDVRQARQAVRAALAREPFDAAALEAALARQRAGTAALQQLMHGAMVQTATRLPPEQRQRWSEAPLWAPGQAPAGMLEDRPPRP
ncbi:periplasmic heavy metal sensor [Algiphilus sp.]|uniref:periplasmic heavy metal sensor n=1 Tax=Algiphilus sp. TaxID=1872431 RepID=UPI003B51BC41